MPTGGRPLLGRISKRGNRYLRVLFVQAARVFLRRPQTWDRHGLKRWIEAAATRMHHNKLTIALANKLTSRAAPRPRLPDEQVLRPPMQGPDVASMPSCSMLSSKSLPVTAEERPALTASARAGLSLPARSGRERRGLRESDGRDLRTVIPAHPNPVGTFCRSRHVRLSDRLRAHIHDGPELRTAPIKGRIHWCKTADSILTIPSCDARPDHTFVPTRSFSQVFQKP